MRLVFAGTPAAAVPSLDGLLKSRHEVAAVVTRPDARAGRGLHVAPSPVAERAGSAGIEVLKPAKPGDADFLARLREIAPDCCPVTAYGALIPQRALDIPAHGWVNLHFSLLPAWRGAAPVQHAILRGDEVTGASTFRIVAELDAGPVFGVMTEPIRPTDTAGDLLARLAASGAELLVATMDGIESGELTARPQPPDGVSLAPKITSEDARVRWSEPALAVSRLVRACTPAPGAWTELNGTRLKLGPFAGIITDDHDGTRGPGESHAPGRDESHVPGRDESHVPGRDESHAPGRDESHAPGRDESDAPGPGELWVRGSRVLVGTGTQPVQLGDVQPHGKRQMAAADWARGLRLGAAGAVLG